MCKHVQNNEYNIILDEFSAPSVAFLLKWPQLYIFLKDPRHSLGIDYL